METKNDTFYWIKLKTNLMYSNEIKLLMRQPDGGWYFSIYIYLIMLSINSHGKLIQKVSNVELVHDLVTLTQELMFFKIDTIRVAIEMLKKLDLLYVDAEGIMYITNFSELVGAETKWAQYKRKQRKKEQLLVGHCLTNVQQESRDKSLESKEDKNRIKKNKMDNNQKTVLTKKLIDVWSNVSDDDFFLLEKNLLSQTNHIFTRYLIHAKYIDADDEAIHKYNRLFAEIDDQLAAKGDILTYRNYQVIVQRFIYKFRSRSANNKEIKNKFSYFSKSFDNSRKSYITYLHDEVWGDEKIP